MDASENKKSLQTLPYKIGRRMSLYTESISTMNPMMSRPGIPAVILISRLALMTFSHDLLWAEHIPRPMAGEMQ